MKSVLVVGVVVIAIVAIGIWWFYLRVPQIALGPSAEHVLEWPERLLLETDLGPVRGLSNGSVHAFLGLPYAKPPTGERRFMPPVPIEPWQETFEALAFPNICMQAERNPTLGGADGFQRSEDCLYLNVFMPSDEGASSFDGTERPVLFWIHGGSFVEGSANDYDGSVLAEQGDVVVVVINYRLGALGFLDLSRYGNEHAGSASNGIRDQILALEWVRDNIADYGGNAQNVTIFGESAGAQSVYALLASPSADGLYHKAIAHSGALVIHPPADHTSALADHLDVESEALLATLRALPAEAVFAAQTGMGSWGGGGNIDGTVVTRSSNNAILQRGPDGVPLVAGFNRDEGTLFSMLIPSLFHDAVGEAVAEAVLEGVSGEQYLAELEAAYPEDSSTERFERIWQDLLTRGAVNSAVRASAAGPGGWLYRFDLPVQRVPGMGATHAAEIAFTFNVFAGDAPAAAFLYDKDDSVVRQLALDWSNSVIQFARTGDPNGAGLPEWPRYTVEHRKALILDGNPRIVVDLTAADLARWGDTAVSDAELR